jgi:3-hydroxymyristoyl/3-hydroxydecanoyl-(acyl carrier protein) dehydratase
MKDVLSKKEIAKKLHITAPFLMIEKFIMLSENKAESVLFTNKNDWFFQCHLPKEQVMPATLIVEAMLQTLVLLIYETFPHSQSSIYHPNPKSYNEFDHT